MVDVETDLTGVVKWYNPARGFGFINCQNFDGDVLLHENVVRNYGLNSVAEGASLKCRVAMTERGAQVSEIFEIVPPRVGNPEFEETVGVSDDEIAKIPLIPARVKWFNTEKGFGFARAFGSDQDIFIHLDVVRRSGMAILTPGEAIALRRIEGERGFMAVDIATWDSVTNDDVNMLLETLS